MCRVLGLRPLMPWLSASLLLFSPLLQCSVLCGTGHRTRHVRCVSNHGELLRDSDCPDNRRPQASEACNMGPCVRSWFYSDWSNTVRIGLGQPRSLVLPSFQTFLKMVRTFLSFFHTLLQLSFVFPATLLLRLPEKLENTQDKGSPEIPTLLFQCSADCGAGIQRRSVVCLSSNADGQADEDCASPKPADMRACDGGPCQRVARWYKGPWSSVRAG